MRMSSIEYFHLHHVVCVRVEIQGYHRGLLHPYAENVDGVLQTTIGQHNEIMLLRAGASNGLAALQIIICMQTTTADCSIVNTMCRNTSRWQDMAEAPSMREGGGGGGGGVRIQMALLL